MRIWIHRLIRERTSRVYPDVGATGGRPLNPDDVRSAQVPGGVWLVHILSTFMQALGTLFSGWCVARLVGLKDDTSCEGGKVGGRAWPVGGRAYGERC